MGIRLGLALGLLSTVAWGQEFRATLTGRVIDPAGAPVLEAAVTINNEGTNVTYSAKTDSHGNYTVPFLPPASYSVTVSAPGFKQAVRSGLQLTVAQATTQDFQLELGSITQEVTVTADAVLLEQANADRGGLIDAESVADYPLNGRNPFMLSMLVPGVDYNGELVYQRPFDNGAIARWNISGSNANNEFLLDGAPNNAQAGSNNIAYVPPVDSVQEFKIQTNAYDAQYGKSAGGIVNVALKSGTNRLHGTAYEYMRRNALDANSFQNNSRGAAKDGHYLDQYGFQMDGPVYFPKLYDGRRKTFFLANYEGYREGTPQPLVLSVPEMDMRNGDFSKLLDGTGRQVVIHDPTTTRTSGNTTTRDPFPGNILPQSRINPISRNIVSYFPEPNTKTAGVAYAQQNYFASGGMNPAKDRFYNLVFKFDQNFGNHHMFFRHGSNDRSEIRSTNGMLDKVGQDGPLPLKRVNDAYVMDWVTTLSPTMILNPRVSFSRYLYKNDSTLNKEFDMTKLGFPASLAASLPYNPGFGRYAMDDYLTLGKNSPGSDVTNTWATAVSLTKLNGTHSTKAGIDLRWIQYAVQNTSTVFQLNNTRVFTQLEYNRTDARYGNSVAGFLLGTPSGGTVNYNAFFIYMSRYSAPWIQHDWKVTSRLTVNMGFRFDWNFPPNERYNRINAGFDRESVSPLDKQVDHSLWPELPSTLRGGIRFAGVNGAPGTAAEPYWKTPQPRFGAAYALGRKTVLRGGWGRYYSNPSNNDYMQSYGFNNQTTMVVSPDSNRTPYPNMVNNPFPRINQPVGAADGLLTYAGRSFNFVNDQFRTPYVHLFSFGIQHALTSSARVEVTYSGNRGYDQQTSKAYNEQDDGTFRDRCNYMLGGNPSYCDASITNPWKNLDAFNGTSWYTANTISRNQILRPFPQFNTFNEYMRNDGRFWYNSLQALFTARTRKGINLNANYTFAKNMQRSGFLDPQNEVMQQGVTQYDRPHRFVTSMISPLPFGRGRRWLNSSHGLADKLVSGWRGTIIFNIQSGMPWALPSNVMYLKDARLPFDWNQEKIQAVKPCVNRWNTNNTITTMPFSTDYGCTEPNWLIVPSYNPRYTPYYEARIRYQTTKMADVSLIKETRINEVFRVEFRAEAFNLANSFFVTQGSSSTQSINNTPDNTNFGTLYKSAIGAPASNYPRQMQFGIKLLW